MTERREREKEERKREGRDRGGGGREREGGGGREREEGREGGVRRRCRSGYTNFKKPYQLYTL